MDVVEKLKYITLLWIRWEDRKSVTSWDVYKNLFLDVIRYIQLIIFVILCVCVCVCVQVYVRIFVCSLYNMTWKFTGNGHGSDVGRNYQLCPFIEESSWGN